MTECLLKIVNLHVCFPTAKGLSNAVDGISLSVNKGEIFGVVGESGCGKSMTALSIVGLISKPGRVSSGEIWLNGENILALPEKEMQGRIRGEKVSMIFQEPMTSLNPLLTVGEQIVESLMVHKHMRRKDAKAQAVRLLRQVGIPEPEKRADDYPHSLSGGMRQRVMIAIAMCCQPELMIADEPTTALDVTIQAQILSLMRSLRDETGTAIILITHDLGVIANTCDRVAVMYCGEIVESGSTYEVLQHPLHPYTKGLMASVPQMESTAKLLFNIPGTVPQLSYIPKGCKFAGRCDQCMEICKTTKPSIRKTDGQNSVSCFLYEESHNE